MNFHHQSLNDMARAIPPDHVFLFFPLRQGHQIIQRSIMKTSLVSKGGSSNIHERKVNYSTYSVSFKILSGKSHTVLNISTLQKCIWTLYV